MNDSDIIIVGGGMVGLSLAVALGQAGLSIAVVDREDPAKVVDAAFDGRTSAIADASVRMLESIGLWRHVAAAQPIQAAPADAVSWKTSVQSAAMPSAPTATTVTTAPG